MTSYRSNMSIAGPSNGMAPGYAAPEPLKPPPEPWMAGHGMPWWMMAPQQPMARWTPWSEEKVANLQVRLARKLGPEYVTQRPGPGGGPKLSYIEGWKVIGLANEVFGFNGWSSSIVSLTTDFLDEKDGRVSCHITAIIRITLQDGCFHEDVGGGQCENVKGKGAALDKAKKEAVTDGIKRALKTFGNVLGNCLYDKEYTKEIVKIKVPPAKFNASDLERRPEFTPAGAPAPTTTNAQGANTRPPPAAGPSTVAQRATTEPPRPGTPLRSINEAGNDATMCEGYTVDENFDAEFFDGEMGEDSMMIEPAPANGGNGFRRVDSAPPAPAYSHRHRPEMPPPPANNRAVADQPGGGEGGGSTSSGGSYGNADARSSVNNADAAAAAARRRAAMQQGFSGGSGGGVAPMQTRSAAAAVPTGPIRAESPRIPSGGIDAVAARASQSFASRAAQLDLEETTTAGKFEGFASARGMKRVQEDTGEGEGVDLYASPTKQTASRFLQSSPRRPLGEVAVGESAHNIPRHAQQGGGGVHFGHKRARPH